MPDDGLQQRGGELERQRDHADLPVVQRIGVLQDRIDRGDQRLHGVVEEVREADAGEHDIGRSHGRCLGGKARRRVLYYHRCGHGFFGDDDVLIQGRIPGKERQTGNAVLRCVHRCYQHQSLMAAMRWRSSDQPDLDVATKQAYAAAAWPSALTIWSTTSSTRSRSSPSPITRITGSVPDERTSSRPWPLRRFSPSMIADFTSAWSSGLPER